MRLIHECDRAALLIGDAAELGQHLPSDSVDAVVTDPPAGIGFMGRTWDGDRGGRAEWVRWLSATIGPAVEALKPGGYCLCWALPRTSGWTQHALELAGLEIRDVIHHVFGQGAPKSATNARHDIPPGTQTALKPAVEHWVLARKPWRGTLADLQRDFPGSGVLQIDACRVGEGTPRPKIITDRKRELTNNTYNAGLAGSYLASEPTTQGRWPANFTTELDLEDVPPYFYCAKPHRSERDLGLDELEPLAGHAATGTADPQAKRLGSYHTGAGRTGGSRNTHPTVKPVALMRYLVRLVTPPGGLVLDPFAGSGSTGVGAIAEGRRFIGAELAEDPRYEAILHGRIKRALVDHPPTV